MLGELSQFHFIRPAFLIMAPIVIVLWFLAKRSLGGHGWEHYLPPETIRALQVGESKRSNWWQWYILLAALIACFAAAGPTWIKQALPTVQNQRALVVILDLSPSMLAQDLKPDRLTRAKYKLIDILRQYKDGQVGLIAYAGEAHTVSPLTDDPKTLQALLPALHPAIMPSQGSNIESAIGLARQLLRDANLSTGEVLLITDGIASSAMTTLRQELGKSIALSVLGVGGAESAPIPAQGGGFLRGRDGQIILSRMNEAELKQLAGQLGGRYARLNNSEADINFLIRDDFQADSTASQTDSDTSFDGWADMGHWFLLLVLPLAAWCFRRGFIYCLPLLFLIPVEHSRADELIKDVAESESIDNNQNTDGFSWGHLWRTPDQRAHDLVQREEYAEAANTFERKDWRAVANYKNGDYATAAKELEGATDAIGLYNKANALALSGELEKALEAYTQALAEQPDHADAKHNKQIVEQLMQQQQEQQQNQQSDSQDNQEQNQDSSSDQSQSSESQTPQEQESENQQSSNKQESQSADQQDNSDPSASQSDDAEQQEAESEKSDLEKPESTGGDEDQESNETEQQGEEAGDQQGEEQEGSQVTAEESSEALKDTSEQWLRGIKDDPSGLLRRKFQYQAEQNRRSAPQQSSTEERY